MTATTPLQILLIESSRDTAQVLEQALNSFGYAVQMAQAPDEAAAKAALQENDTPLIFCDADSNTVPLARVAALQKRHAPHAALLALSDRVEAAAVAAAMRSGAVDLVFPDERSHLKAVVDRELARYRASLAAAHSDDHYRMTEDAWLRLLDSIHDPVAFLHQGLHVHANSAYLRLLGLEDAEEVQGLSLLDMVARDDHALLREQFRAEGTESHTGEPIELNFRTAEGETIPASAVFTPALFQDEACLCLTIIGNTAATAAVPAPGEHQDLLTGLLDRAGFASTLADALADDPSGHVMWYFTLGRNDALTTQQEQTIVEHLLWECAQLLRERCTDALALGRVGAADFAVLHHDPEHALDEALQQIRDALSTKVAEIDWPESTPLCASAALPLDHLTKRAGEDVLAQARALSHDAHRQNSTKSSKNSAATPEPEADEAAELGNIEAQLATALKDNRLETCFLPITALRGTLEEAYAVQAQLPGEAANDAPLSSVKNPKLTGALDRWLLTQCLNELAQAGRAKRPMALFLNVSLNTLRDAALLEKIAGSLKKAKVPAGHLVLTLNAASYAAHLEEARLLMEQLQAAGCAVAVCDMDEQVLTDATPDAYGAVDYLALAPQLVRPLGDNANFQQLVRNACETLRQDKQSLIAYGVENAQCLSFLWQVGADYAQGDFLQGAVDSLELEAASG